MTFNYDLKKKKNIYIYIIYFNENTIIANFTLQNYYFSKFKFAMNKIIIKKCMIWAMQI